MMAEQIYDSISQATGIFLEMPGRPGRRRPGLAQGNALQQAYARALPDGPVTRIMQLAALPPGAGNRFGGNLVAFLDAFGKPRRESVCECERSAEGNMSQALALINGEVNTKIADRFGRVAQVADSSMSEAAAIEELYLAALSRRPAPAEVDEAIRLARSASSRREGLEDVMWGLLNSREFLFVH
jgi:hypothetical protein